MSKSSPRYMQELQQREKDSIAELRNLERAVDDGEVCDCEAEARRLYHFLRQIALFFLIPCRAAAVTGTVIKTYFSPGTYHR